MKSLAEAREVIRNSFEIDEYLPEDKEAWEAAYEKLLELQKMSK